MASNGVVVVGAGPTGLMLACELALGGVPVQLVEERTSTPNVTRAFAVHARTLELLDARGLADRLLPEGLPVYELTPPGGATLDLRDLPTRFGMVLIVPQSGTEHLLETRAGELGVTVRRGAEVVGLAQHPGEVTVELAGGETVAADYVVGCDGAHSTVRRLAGIDFVGKQYQTHILLADVRLAAPPGETLFAATGPQGVVLFVPFGDGWFRAIAWDRLREQAPLSEPVTVQEMRGAFDRIAGHDFGMGEMRWSSRFLSERRQARQYRSGRVFLAGDAAHVHSPLGGQGMNTGLGDAVNLGWKLAAAVRGQAPAWLLDSYEKERHPVGAQVLQLTDAFNQLVLGSWATRRIRALAVATAIRIPRSRRFLTGRLSGIGIAYPRERSDHQLVGRRLPDVDLRDGGFAVVEDRPGLPAAVLVRPDGYAAWAGERSELAGAVEHWHAWIDR
ncbi:FAD-dependent monooxygenase [Mycolicibacterium fluoranthenivorans]|uniref:FAD-dependent monooxygenase n=1 Tax=Mycolicibacterium fluoranthenivorans TaxID=258505 RepID=A0A7G8PIZ3_9MYCO|nr:FAD-dependent monooxygenase [Mycolicibacterium fluoranthenivorans]QNJ94309.1 FAD-dependent monooxygenase [Mycolicibacterium fluoranthenivorans]